MIHDAMSGHLESLPSNWRKESHPFLICIPCVPSSIYLGTEQLKCHGLRYLFHSFLTSQKSPTKVQKTAGLVSRIQRFCSRVSIEQKEDEKNASLDGTCLMNETGVHRTTRCVVMCPASHHLIHDLLESERFERLSFMHRFTI